MYTLLSYLFPVVRTSASCYDILMIISSEFVHWIYVTKVGGWQFSERGVKVKAELFMSTKVKNCRWCRQLSDYLWTWTCDIFHRTTKQDMFYHQMVTVLLVNGLDWDVPSPIRRKERALGVALYMHTFVCCFPISFFLLLYCSCGSCFLVLRVPTNEGRRDVCGARVAAALHVGLSTRSIRSWSPSPSIYSLWRLGLHRPP